MKGMRTAETFNIVKKRSLMKLKKSIVTILHKNNDMFLLFFFLLFSFF